MLKRWIAMFVVGACGGFAVAVVSCSSGTTTSGTGGGTGGGTTGGTLTCAASASLTCQTVGDCQNSTNFKCDASTNCCQFFCTQVSDCGGQYDPGDACKTSSLGCVCDQGQCKSKQCSTDTDCGSGGNICKGGNCQAADPVANVASIVVEPNPAIVHVGAAQQFTATLLDSSGKAVVAAAGSVTWTASAGTISATGSFSPTAASTTFGDVTITATVTAGGKSGTAIATVYAAPTSGTQVTLIDAAANVPVSDATIQYSDASRNLVGTAITTSSALGVYQVGTPPATAVLLNVFDLHHQYASVVLTNVTTSDLVIFLAQNAVIDATAAAIDPTKAAAVGGYTGDFRAEPGILDPNAGQPASAQGDIHFGVAGTAVPQDLLDISVTALLGPSHPVTINIAGTHVVSLPQGIELGFGTSYFKCSYDGLGAAGGCGLPLCSGSNSSNCLNSCTDDTGSSCSGASWAQSVYACGTRSAWGLGGNIPFAAVASQLGNLGSGSVNVGTLLTAILPEFSTFNSAVTFDVPFTLAAPVTASAVTDSCSGKQFTDSAPIPNPTSLNSNVTLGLDTPLALQASVQLPPLPTLGGTCQSTALILAGAIEPGFGLLPLGLSAGTTLNASNTPSSTCKTYDTDTASATNADGHVTLNLAPEHGGVERDGYGVLALSLDPSILTSGTTSTRSGVSGVLQTYGNPSPGLAYGTSVAFSNAVGGFLVYAEGATYSWGSQRTFSNAPTAQIKNATWQRVRFQDDQFRQWLVYFDPSVTSFALPKPPGAFADRTYNANGTSPASAEAQQVEATAGTTFNGYFDFTNGALATDLIDHMAAFNEVDMVLCTTGC